MAEHQYQTHHQEPHHTTTETIKSYLPIPQKTPSTPQLLAVVTLLPVGGILLTLAGLTLAGTLIGLTVATPLFVIFSPILIPALLTIAFAVTGFITAGGFGITALSSVSWLVNYLRGVRGSLPEHFEHGRKRMQDTAAYVGQKTKDVGQKTQDVVRSS